MYSYLEDENEIPFSPDSDGETPIERAVYSVLKDILYGDPWELMDRIDRTIFKFISTGTYQYILSIESTRAENILHTASKMEVKEFAPIYSSPCRENCQVLFDHLKEMFPRLEAVQEEEKVFPRYVLIIYRK